MYALILALFTLIAQPKAGSRYNIVEYGAVGDGSTINTKVIQKVIDKASESGGGEVIVPPGRFITSTLVLKSNVNLHLEKNAVLLGDLNPYDYPSMAAVLDKPTRHYPNLGALIEATRASNISISGEGTINGRGRQVALNMDSLFYAGKLDTIYYNLRRKRPGARPRLLGILQCNNVSITGVTIKNAAGWVEEYQKCHNVTIHGIRVESDAYWNNDGMDIVDCVNVRITNCFVNSADDGICLKSEFKGFLDDSIYVADCTVRSSASAVKFGTASVGGFKNVVIKNIRVYDTFRSAIAVECVDGGVLENVLVDGITAVNTGNPIFIRLGHRDVNGPWSVLRNVTIENVSVVVPFGRPDKNYDLRGPALPYFHNPFPSPIIGLPGHPIKDVVIRNITISMPGRGNRGMAIIPLSRLEEVPENAADYPEFSRFGELPSWGFYVRHVDGLTFQNIFIKARAHDFRPCFVFDDANHVKFDGVTILKPNNKPPVILRDVRNSTFEKIHTPGYKGQVIRRVRK